MRKNILIKILTFLIASESNGYKRKFLSLLKELLELDSTQSESNISNEDIKNFNKIHRDKSYCKKIKDILIKQGYTDLKKVSDLISNLLNINIWGLYNDYGNDYYNGSNSDYDFDPECNESYDDIEYEYNESQNLNDFFYKTLLHEYTPSINWEKFNFFYKDYDKGITFYVFSLSQFGVESAEINNFIAFLNEKMDNNTNKFSELKKRIKENWTFRTSTLRNSFDIDCFPENIRNQYYKILNENYDYYISKYDFYYVDEATKLIPPVKNHNSIEYFDEFRSQHTGDFEDEERHYLEHW